MRGGALRRGATAFLAAALLLSAVGLAAPGARRPPRTLAECMHRPSSGYATPALRRRMRLCARFIRAQPPPATAAWLLAERH